MRQKWEAGTAARASITAACHRMDTLREELTQCSGPSSAATAPPGGGRRPACEIFKQAGQARREFKHRERISADRVALAGHGGGGNLTVEAAVDAYREARSARLGCSVSDINWLIETPRFPEICEDSPITSNIETPRTHPV